MPVTSWSTSPSSNNAAPPNGWPEGMPAAAVNDTARQQMADLVIEFQKNQVKVLGSVSGTNTITASMTPALTAYSAGMTIVFTPANTNTGATTLNINGLGALDVQRGNSAALVAGDLLAGIPAYLVLDSGADDWTLLNPQDFARLSQTNTFSANGAAGSSAIQIRATVNPFLFFGETGAAANNKFWDIGIDSEGLIARIINDAGSTTTTWLRVDRTDTTVDAINLQATALQYNGTEVGFRGLPQNSQSSNYTLVAADAGKHIIHPSGGGAGDTFTIPANGSVAYAIGTAVTFINADSNSVSIAITTDTMTLAGTTTTGTRTLAQNGIATAVKVTSTGWLISGTGLS